LRHPQQGQHRKIAKADFRLAVLTTGQVISRLARAGVKPNSSAAWRFATVIVLEIARRQQLIHRISQQTPEFRIVQPSRTYHPADLRQRPLTRAKRSVNAGQSAARPNLDFVKISARVAGRNRTSRVENQDEPIAPASLIFRISDKFASLLPRWHP